MASDWSQDHYIRAYRFSAQAHWKKAQLVPGTQIPYLMHFSLVAMEVIAALSVEPVTDGDLAVQSALLHDTLEDTDITYDDLVDGFGQRVAESVAALTKDESLSAEPPHQGRRISPQMADSLRRIQSQPKEIWMVKMSDRITNLQPPPHYWTRDRIERYKQESIEIHEALKDSSPLLAARLKSKINAYPK
jgi:(p)ppGpp synthase/HD superfamily hydrolase